MFKKRKAAKKQLRLDAFAKREAQFLALVAAAEQIADPAQKLLSLEAIKNSSRAETRVLYLHASNVDGKIFGLGGGLGGMALAIGGSALLPHVVIPVLIGGGALGFGGIAGQIFSDAREAKERTAEVIEHDLKMESHYSRVDGIEDALIAERMDQIAQSPLYDRVLKQSALSAKFADAALKRAAKLQEDAAARQKTAERPAPQDPPSAPQVRDYRKFNDFLDGK